MALIKSRAKKEKGGESEVKEKFLEVDASMQGDFCFKDPVNLKINGKFQGNLNTKGTLIINKDAFVEAEIKGEDIDIAGKVNGNVFAADSLILRSSAKLAGNIETPSFAIEKGAVFNGKCNMDIKKKEINIPEQDRERDLMGLKELSEYIDVDEDSILKWIDNKKIPAKMINNNWKFNRKEIDNWITSSR